jgi:hypothetical protein
MLYKENRSLINKTICLFFTRHWPANGTLSTLPLLLLEENLFIDKLICSTRANSSTMQVFRPKISFRADHITSQGKANHIWDLFLFFVRTLFFTTPTTRMSSSFWRLGANKEEASQRNTQLFTMHTTYCVYERQIYKNQIGFACFSHVKVTSVLWFFSSHLWVTKETSSQHNPINLTKHLPPYTFTSFYIRVYFVCLLRTPTNTVGLLLRVVPFLRRLITNTVLCVRTRLLGMGGCVFLSKQKKPKQK